LKGCVASSKTRTPLFKGLSASAALMLADWWPFTLKPPEI
jgi:hypothetical protein